jgi:hypothetical protein
MQRPSSPGAGTLINGVSDIILSSAVRLPANCFCRPRRFHCGVAQECSVPIRAACAAREYSRRCGRPSCIALFQGRTEFPDLKPAPTHLGERGQRAIKILSLPVEGLFRVIRLPRRVDLGPLDDVSWVSSATFVAR